MDTLLGRRLVGAQRCGNRLAFQGDSTGALTHGDLLMLLAGGQSQLRAAGLQPQSRVAAIFAGSDDGLLKHLLCLCSACHIPLNPASPEPELASYLSDLRADALLVDDAARWRSLADRLGLPLIQLDLDQRADRLYFRCRGSAHAVTTTIEAATPALILLTSGSTGRPKAVPLSTQQLCVSAANVISSLLLTEQDVALNMMPQFHVGALIDLLLAPLLAGGAVVASYPFSAQRVYSSLSAFPVTWLQAVPTMLKEIVDDSPDGGVAAPRLRLVRAVSSPMPASLLAQVEALLQVPVIEIYGMSESAGLITSNPLPPALRLPGSVGQPIGMNEVMIADSLGHGVAAGEPGEVCVRGPSVMAGYLNGDGKEFRDGWLLTGDRGYLDQQGNLYLCGRIKDIINRGGEKISPAEIDALAVSMPEVVEAAAFAVPHPALGEDVGIALVMTQGAELTDAELQRRLGMYLAAYKVPRRIFRVSELPRAPGGKLQRDRLRTLLDTENGPAVGMNHTLDALELKVAHLWQDVLRITAVRAGDDFYDLGGDSLKTLRLLERLHDLGYHGVTAATIFERPTLRELCSHLRNIKTLPVLQQVEPDNNLPPQGVISTLRGYLRGWKGERYDERSFLVGRNTDGSRPALFWCVNATHEFDRLADALGKDQPFYGMRTLFRVPDRKPDYIPLLARHYVSEMLQIQPKGHFIVGGFCEGAKYAFDIASELQRRGREVALLILHEQFVPYYYDGRIAMYMCPRELSPLHRFFYSPERAWPFYYPNLVRLEELPTHHEQCYEAVTVVHLAERLRRDIDSLMTDSFPVCAPASGSGRLADEDMRVEIEADWPWLMRAGHQRTLTIKVRNIGASIWDPETHSLLRVGCRWLKRTGQPRWRLAGSVPITAVLKPGASICLQLPVEAPERSPAIWRLQIDVIQDGVCWFSECGGALLARRVLIV